MYFMCFIPIHHSFGFFYIFLEGGLETPKTPLGSAPDNIIQSTHYVEQTRIRLVSLGQPAKRYISF